jgi:UDP-N-acetylmuramoyl-L-alanyl-D-glutamate--2,6-diaminopimelate ligase
MIGVTGTDGKSTTVNLIYQILRSAGVKIGMLSTIKAAIGEDEEPLALHVTTPEAPVIQEYLHRMVDAGLTHCVLEATSHGLSQDRVGAIDFDLAVVTNITHEHLDYHGGFKEYLDAKSKLFSMIETVFPPPEPLSPLKDANRVDSGDLSSKRAENIHQLSRAHQKHAVEKTAVLNRDDESFFHLEKLPIAKQITYGLVSPADVFASNIVYKIGSTSFDLNLPRKLSNDKSSISITSSMVGPFNVYNMMAAASAAHALGIDGQDIKDGLDSDIMLRGRMQPIDQGQSFSIIVDFAHTPNALLKAITAARNLTSGQVITVFGSAGKRDVQKRRMMAEVSAREADITILTAEDPRTEVLEDILDMMAEGCRSQGGVEGQSFWRITDRGQAIYFALTKSRSRDLVLICGKGHEQSMCFGTTEFPWDDIEATRVAVDSMLAGEPMPDLGLPTFTGR